MKKLGLALLLTVLGLAPAQAQSVITMPPPAGIVVMGIQVVQTCGTASLTANQIALVVMDRTGVLCTSSSGGGGGGLSVTDQTTWIQGTSAFTPNGGVFNDTATLSSGQEGTQRFTTKRAGLVDVDTSGNALYTVLNSINTNVQATGTVQGAQSNASDAIATGSISVPGLSYNLGWNGSTWDRLQVDGSKNLKVVSAAADPCQGNVATIKSFSITTNTTTNIVTGTSAKKLYVCYLYMQTAAANNVAVISGTTGATCGANTAGLVGGTTAANGLNNAANGGQAMGNGGYSVLQVQTNNDDICLITSAATPLAGVIKYVVQ